MTRLSVPAACFSAMLLLSVARGQGSAATLPTAARPAAAPAALSGTPLSVASFLAHRDTTPLYTEEQAANGATLFAKVCVECHEPADYTGPKFREKWNGLPMLDLYEQIRTKMPDDNPGSLTRDQYAEALAYILKQNGVPAGPSKIAPDSVAMSAVKLNLPPTPH